MDCFTAKSEDLKWDEIEPYHSTAILRGTMSVVGHHLDRAFLLMGGVSAITRNSHYTYVQVCTYLFDSWKRRDIKEWNIEIERHCMNRSTRKD